MPALHPPPPISPTHAVGERGRPSHAQSQPALRVERPGLRRVAPAGRACADAQARGRHTHRSTMRTVVDAAWRQRVTDHLPPPSEPAAYAPCLHAWTLGGGGVQFRLAKHLCQRTKKPGFGTTLKKNPFFQSGKGCPSCAKTRVGAGTAEVGEGRPRSCRRAARAGEGNWSRRRSLPSDPSFCAHTHAHTRRREGRIHCSGDFERAANDCQRRAEARRA